MERPTRTYSKEGLPGRKARKANHLFLPDNQEFTITILPHLTLCKKNRGEISEKEKLGPITYNWKEKQTTRAQGIHSI